MSSSIDNIAEIFIDTARKQGSKRAVVEAATGREVTFAALLDMVEGYANYFSEKGVRPGDRVILMVTPSVDFIALTFGLFKIGATIILIDPGMGYKNLLNCIEGVRPDVFIGIPKAYLFCSLFRKPFRTIRKKFCCGKSYGLFGEDIRSGIEKATVGITSYQPGDDDLAAIIFTTGSTGPPKGVRYEHSIFAAQLRRINSYYGIDDTHVDQPAFPLFGLFSAALGATTIIPDMDPTKPAKVDPQVFVSSIIKYGVSYSFGSPAIWNVVSNYCLQEGIMLNGLGKVLMAGAPVPGELLERVVKILPEDAMVYTPYGATESLPVVSIESREILNSTLALSAEGKGTCVGRPLPGIEVRVIEIQEDPIENMSQTIPSGTGVIGEIIVSGDVVTRAYENNIEETRLSKIQDNSKLWHRMGDTGYLDESGRLWFCGRKAHRVLRASGPMFTIPCEAIANGHHDVYRSALVGVPKNGMDDVLPVMILEPMKDFDGSNEELIREVRALLQGNELTNTIEHILIHDDFPVDIRHNAKIFREKLAVWAAEQLEASK